MSTETYINGRKKYARPQAMLWSENSGTLVNGIYVPNGFEINADATAEPNQDLHDQFLILSDDNRGEISFNNNRIEKRERMINGRMRSYHIADKKSISISWNMLPSRSSNVKPSFDANGNPIASMAIPGVASVAFESYTTDGGAGGVDIVDWYDNHKGSFWVYLAYDKYTNFDTKTNNYAAYAHLSQYNELIEMFVSDFNYTVVKRGGSNYDFWNISCTLEEV